MGTVKWGTEMYRGIKEKSTRVGSGTFNTEAQKPLQDLKKIIVEKRHLNKTTHSGLGRIDCSVHRILSG
jgi:hypothetical protein